MPWKEPLWLKIRRRLQTPLSKLIHRNRYHVAHYRGADFLLAPRSITALEVSAKIFEYPELSHLMQRCADLKVDTFIDVGANIGIYSCVLLKNTSVPRAMLFEPERMNLIHLRANLLINGLTDRAEVYPFALGDTNTQSRILPGAITRNDYALADGGFSMLVDDDSRAEGTYEVDVARFDDRFALSGRALAIKIDIEHYECKALIGMERTLRQNRCIVQVESYAQREQVMAIMEGFGYAFVKDFTPNFVFENRG